MATRQAHKRLTKEYKLLVESSPPFILARPNEDNILEWHYIITGPPDTPYDGGQYHGTLTFPNDYPYKPPAIRMITPNGRFKENTRLCLSMSDYHPDTWNPGWSVSTILNGLLSFMTGNEATTGSITTTDAQKRKLASQSVNFNTYQNARFKRVFPDIVNGNLKTLEEARKGRSENAADDKDLLTKVSQEKPVLINDIVDPEDRIRAEQIVNDSLNGKAEVGNKGFVKGKKSFKKLYFGIGILILLIGLSMR
ncbi:E2 ubiquitin-conjugating protein UBC6 NDAI_0A01650 [Naumovozyma dairenensis CBS 421]|uniref:Ubiquitin-conjugating enzyme E2 6 n=1 Tax=Naumovozyma dairenensis (strain ATCC 10597 / BCRC 20456 / CBS 421 / NBRC 0211 / NRRL Y-12639) TaxID=1071378 RepID=G0W3D5_NAUDC|nr:hypothetical protein NDAI_0A01650 [Naumovozyma dairenensis CBS 421]CCD22323.1 hypothetical protein NDAI_0A01650 [Naumovozyma dairenensis CBS 421]